SSPSPCSTHWTRSAASPDRTTWPPTCRRRPARCSTTSTNASATSRSATRGVDDRESLHFDKRLLVPQPRDADARHRGVVAADQSLPHRADLAGVRAVVGHVDDVDGDAGQLAGLTACFAQRGEQIAQRLLELLDDGLADDRTLGVQRGLTGE